MKPIFRILLDPAPTDGNGSPSPATEPAPVVTPPVEPTPAADPPQAEPDAEPAPVEDTASDALLGAILGDLKGTRKEVSSDDPLPEVVPAADPAVTPAAPVVATPPVEPAPTPEPRKPKKIVISEPAEPAPAPAVVPVVPVAPPTSAPVDPDAAYVAGLTDEQRDELSEVEVAERLYPERYKDAKKKLLAFYRKFDLEAPKISDPDENPEFKRLMESKPAISQLDAKLVQREIGKQEAAAKVRQELAPEIESLKMGQAEIKARPVVAATLNQLESDLNKMFVEDEKSPMRDISKAFAEKGKTPDGVNSVIEEFPMEAAIAQAEIQRSRAMLAEYTLFQNRATKFDQNNPAHTELFKFIEQQGDALQAAGGLLKGGKTFLTRTQYADQVAASGRDAVSKKFFTFSDDDVKRLITEDAKIQIETKLKSKLEEAKRFGFERKSKTQSATTPTQANATPAAPVTATTAPRATPSRAKGAGGAEITPAAPTNAELVNTLGLRGVRSAVV